MGDNASPPKTFSESIIETAIFLSKEWGMSPFEVMQQDIDDFILFANYLINLSKNKEQNDIKPAKINDGFWDFD